MSHMTWTAIRHQSRLDCKELWDQLTSTIFVVVDDEGIEEGKIRHLTAQHWLYLNNFGSYQILNMSQIKDHRFKMILPTARCATLPYAVSGATQA